MMDMDKTRADLEALHCETKEGLLIWADQFENDHYVLDVYGEQVTIDLSRQTVEEVMDISLTLVDRVVMANGELTTAEYMELEEKVREQYPEDGSWLLHIVMEAVRNDRLFGRYKDIEPQIGALNPRGYPMGTAAYLLLVRPEIHKLIYAVIRHVDDAVENYKTLVYTFMAGILTKCWGVGFGWSKNEEGNWVWHNSESNDENGGENQGQKTD